MTIPMNRADAIIVPSQWCADVLRRYTQLPIYVVPLGVDTTEYIGSSARVPTTSRSAGCGSGPTICARVGLLSWKHGGAHFLPRWDTELYLKTTITKEDIRSAILKEELDCAVGGQGVMRQMGPNITMDSRKYLPTR